MTKTCSHRERRGLQVALVVAACVPVLAGGAGMITGTAILSEHPGEIALDSHVRYLSGLLFGIGLSFWAIVPRIETHTALVRLLTFLVGVGGIARLAGAVFVVMPSRSMIYAIVMELVVTPLLCWWQSRIANLQLDR
ncbi:MAG: conserved membrane protein of unknown function [Nitrospira sp.]|nr:MAG: conserved membrane protein of unknown function [Nitrospira sp.]